MPLKAVLFDLDGTLVDSLADIAGSMNRTLVRRGHPPHRVEAYRGFIGEGVEHLVRRALPGASPDELAQVLAAYRADYLEHLFDGSPPYPGIPELLQALRARGVPLAVLSNKAEPATVKLAEGLFPGLFAQVRGERPGTPKKPDPTAALALAAALGVAPADCAFVGDTAIDMKTARAAGMVPVGVAWGFRPEELVPHGAAHVLSHPRELLALLPSEGTRAHG